MEVTFSSVYSWLYVGGFKILIILLGAFLLNFISKKISKKVIKTMLRHAELVSGADGVVEDNRLKTITHIYDSTVMVVVMLIAIVMVLSEFGFNIAPIIAGAGIIGLAVGFGSQSLVKDLVSGLFILIESQYNVGDKVSFGSISGTKVRGEVKKMNLRRTVVKDDEGNTHTIPNGSILLVTKLV